MSGYAKKLQGGGGGRGEQRWYQLGEDDVLYIYGAHEVSIMEGLILASFPGSSLLPRNNFTYDL